MQVVFLFLIAAMLIPLVIGLFGFLFFHIATIFTGAPYLGTTSDRLSRIIKIARVKPGEITVDLGCGDGRILIAFAKAGAIAYGYELNPFLVLFARWKIAKAGLSNKAHVIWRNFFHVSLSKFDVITVYGITYMMDSLKQKLKKEMNPNSRIISNCYRFKNSKPVRKHDFVYVYRKASL